MEAEPFFDFYHDHPYHQLNVGQEVEVVHEDIQKKFDGNSGSPIFDKKIFKDVLNKGLPIPKEWLDYWKNIPIKELRPYVDLDVLFNNWNTVLPTIKKDTKLTLLRYPSSHVREKTAEPLRKSILLTPAELPLPEIKNEKKWEIKCEVCSKILRGGNKRYEAHMKNSHKIRCICGEEFQSKIQLRSHLKKESNNKVLHGCQPADIATTLFECDSCDEIFRTLAVAEKHRQIAHNRNKTVIKAPEAKPLEFNCRSCKLQFKDRVSLLNHYSSKTCPDLQKKIFKYFCSVCHKGYHCKKTCREHLKIVHNIRSRAEVFVKHITNKDKQFPAETQKEDSQQNASGQPGQQKRNDPEGPLLPNLTISVNSSTDTNDLPTHTKAGSVIYYSLARSRSNTRLNK